jgi:hypothetical protein
MPKGIAKTGFKLTTKRLQAGILNPHLQQLAAELEQSKNLVKRYGVETVKKALSQMGSEGLVPVQPSADSIPFNTTKAVKNGPGRLRKVA